MHSLRALAALLALVGMVEPAGASLIPQGPEIRVDSDATFGPTCPLVAGDANGSFEVVWTEKDLDAPGSLRVRSRQFSWQGVPSGPPRMLATASVGPHDLVSLPGGGYRAVWKGFAGPFEAVWWSSLFGRFGGPLTPFARLRAPSYAEVVSIRPSGGFVAARSRGPAGGGIALQLLDARGRKVGGEQRLNTTRFGYPPSVRFAHQPDGGFMALFAGTTWSGADALFSRPYSPTGQPLGGEHLVASTPLEPEGGIRLGPAAALADGRIALASSTARFNLQSLHLHLLSPTGVPSRAPIRIVAGDIEGFSVFLQGIATGPRGEVVVLWQRETDFCPDGAGFPCNHLFARLYDGSGAPASGVVAVDTPAADPFDNAHCGEVTAAGESFVVSWMGANFFETEEYVVFARRFAATVP